MRPIAFTLSLCRASRHCHASANVPRCSFVNADWRHWRRGPARRRPSLASHRTHVVRAELDPYQVLGVSTDADDMTIKKAYRRAALRSHPDVNKAPDAEERFRRIQVAYATLADRAKRAAYDQTARTAPRGTGGTGGFGPGFADFAGAAAANSGFGNAADFAKRWREKNPMPEDINDSLGSIFADLFSGVSGAVDRKSDSSAGVFEDFVEFLENQMGGFVGGPSQSSGYDSDGSSADDGLDEILATGNVDVLTTELEDSTFLLSQLRARETKLRADAESVQARAAEWAARARRSNAQLDYDSRQASGERENELKEEAKRLRTRQKKVARQIRSHEERQARIKTALEERQQTQSSATPGGAAPVRDKDTQRREVDDELERLKREMGL
jgi:curved DNA-binding protein CbpA